MYTLVIPMTYSLQKLSDSNQNKPLDLITENIWSGGTIFKRYYRYTIKTIDNVENTIYKKKKKKRNQPSSSI